MTRTVSLLGGLSLALSFLAGCDAPGFTTKGPSTPSAVDPNATTPVGQARLTNASMKAGEGYPHKDPGAIGLQTSSLGVSTAIMVACGIPPRKNGADPGAATFDYDSAQLGADDREMLGLVAKCLTEGALRGRKVTLIGRADPRGEEEYNMNLGSSRADTVHRYMVDLGVGRERMTATSRGELDATGKDEAGWAKDRRVDVTLSD